MIKTSDSVRIDFKDLTEWGTEVLRTCGMSSEEIEEVMEILVAANLRGIDTHGIAMLQSYAERYKSINHKDIEIIADSGAACIIDGGNHTGPMVSKFALNEAMKRADKYGIGMATAGESCHNGAVGYYSMLAAKKGYISFSTTTVMPLLAPWGGLEPFTGNNPFAVGIPYKEFPLVLDVAITVAARQKIFSYLREGWTLPDGWAMDKNGKPTNDPQSAIDGLLMPIGEYKGVGMALVIDMILGALNGGAFSRGICANTVTDRPQHISHMFTLINPELLLDIEKMESNIEQYVNDFRNVNKKEEVNELMLPGEVEWRNECDRRKNGVPITMSVLNAINDYADKVGVKHII